MSRLLNQFWAELWEQIDGSIIDLNWEIITSDTKDQIIACIESLPITQRLKDIQEAFKSSDIIFIEAETGSWKSTQLPKLLSKFWTIYSTQPRVPAAIGLANRVSQELLAQTSKVIYTLGHWVGYRTWKWKSSQKISPISFHTDGYELLRMMSTKKTPDIIILDEFHSESIPTVFLTYLLRELKKENHKIKIVITSATMDTEKALEYFDGTNNIKQIPVLKIEWRPQKINRFEEKASALIWVVDKVYNKGQNMLIFAPGKNEINNIVDSIKWKLGEDIDIRILHWELSIEEQNKVMLPPNGDSPVIIVSTNVAEESITIPFIDVVIDSSTCKEASIDKNGVERLDLKNISQANATQREWRAARVTEGDAYRVNDTPKELLPPFPTAPIKLQTTEREILTLALGWILYKDNLEKHKNRWEKMLLDNPNNFHVEIAYDNLFLLWAINEAWEITELWKEMLQYPLSVNNSRMLIEGINRWVTKNILEIVSIMENNWFLIWNNNENDEEEKNGKL